MLYIMFKKNKTLVFLWQFVKNYKWSFISSALLIVACDALDLIGSNTILRNFIDKATNNNLNSQQGFTLILLYIFCTSLMSLAAAIKRKTSFGYQYKLKEDIRNYVFNYSLHQSSKFFNNNFVGTLNSKINDITNSVGDCLNKFIDIISNLNVFIVVLFIFAQKNVYFALFFLCWTIIYFYIYFKFSVRIEKQTEIASNKESKCSGKIIDCFTNILNIKNFSKEKHEKYNVKKHTKTILEERSKINWLKAELDVINFLGKLSFTGVVALISLKMYFDKTITLGDLTFNITISAQLFWWLRWALQMISENIESYGKIKQAVDTLLVEREILDKSDAKILNMNSGKIVFKNINFKY